MPISTIVNFFIHMLCCIGDFFKKLCGRLPTIFVSKTPNFLCDLPVDIVGEVFSKLDHESAKNLKNSCSFLTEIYKRCRSSIEGPMCDAWVVYEKGVLTLKVQIQKFSESLDCWIKEEVRTVGFDDWRQCFQNAECTSMKIETDTDIPENIVDKVFCCENANYVTYKGDTINKKTLEKLNSLTDRTIDLTVNRWIHGMKGVGCLECVDILGDNSSFEELIELIKWVSNINLKMKPENFEKSISALEQLKTGTIDIGEWNLDIPAQHDEKFKLVVVREFMEQMERISNTEQLWSLKSETSLSLGGILSYRTFY